jgi:predicted DNA-binding ribbon-helix-helix protein
MVSDEIAGRQALRRRRRPQDQREDAFWTGLQEIAGRRDITLSDLVAAIDSQRHHGNLSSAIRLFVLEFYRQQRIDQQADPAKPGETG